MFAKPWRQVQSWLLLCSSTSWSHVTCQLCLDWQALSWGCLTFDISECEQFVHISFSKGKCFTWTGKSPLPCLGPAAARWMDTCTYLEVVMTMDRPIRLGWYDSSGTGCFILLMTLYCIFNIIVNAEWCITYGLNIDWYEEVNAWRCDQHLTSHRCTPLTWQMGSTRGRRSCMSLAPPPLLETNCAAGFTADGEQSEI